MKKLVPAYILSFVISFMLFIYEPLLLYSTNVNDFWFDFSWLFAHTFIVFLLVFLLLSTIYTVIYLLSKKVVKKVKLYEIILVMSFSLFLLGYIQGNYLIANLPALDGSVINWNIYTIENIITVISAIIILIVQMFTIKKKGYDLNLRYSSVLTLCIFVMLSVSLVPTLLTNENVFKSKEQILVTNEDYNTYSMDKNFVIFLVDAVDSVMFENVIQNNEQYKNTFDNFTYYPDTVSPYLFTRDVIPFVMSGVWNENETDFLEYYDKAFSESILINSLKENEYVINLYDSELMGQSVLEIGASNVQNKVAVNMVEFVKQEIKYVLFKYLPFPLKSYSKIETMNFSVCRTDKEHGVFNWDNRNFYDMMNNEFNITEEKIFKFIHLEGGHVPFNYDEDLNYIDNGTYEQKLTSTLKVVDHYINKLKEENVYDNSVIIIMADHGYDFANVIGRQNPILFIKGIEEEHEMYESDKPISFEDFNEAYLNLLDGKASVDLFNNIDMNRERRFLYYQYTKEENMTEYVQTGKAWDESTIKETGKKFNR